MYKIVMYDDDDKIIEYVTDNFYLMSDVAVELINKIDFYRNWKNDRHE